MAKQQHLSKAPITEALIDIRVTLPKHTREMDYLAALYEKLLGQYPDKKTIKEFQYKVDFDRPETEEKRLTELGFRYTNADNTQVIQATLNGLTFSRLPPYEDWTLLRDEARRVWNIYSDYVQPESITRAAARYINNLTFLSPHTDFDHYLNYVPAIPKVLPQVLAGFFSRVVVPDEKSQCAAIITQRFQPYPSEVTVVLDIDVFREKVFTDEQETWATIEYLREFKNLIFFDSLTEKAIELYK